MAGIILSNRLRAMQEAASNFGDSIQGIRSAQKLAARQAEQDKMTKSKFDQEQELGGLQISSAKAKVQQEADQQAAFGEAQGFANDIQTFGTAVPDSAIGLPGMQTMQSARPAMDETTMKLKDRLTASMENSIAKSEKRVSALTGADIRRMREDAGLKKEQGLQTFGLGVDKAKADIENTKAGTKKTESEIGAGRYKDVGLSDNRLGVLNTRTGKIEDTGETVQPKPSTGNDRIIANTGEVLIPDLEPIQGVQITHDSVKKTKEGFAAYQAFKNQLDGYKALVKKQGSELVGEKADTAGAMLTDLGMKLKGLQDLGVLTGNDWALMMKQLPETSGIKASLKGKSYALAGQDAFGPQLSVLSNSMDDKFNVFAKTNGFKRTGNTGGPKPQAPSITKPEEEDEYQAWKKGQGR